MALRLPFPSFSPSDIMETLAIDLDDPDLGRITLEQYLEAEAASDGKHEYFDGRIVTLRPASDSPFYSNTADTMGGASNAHNLVASSIARLLGNVVAEEPIAVVQSDCRVWVPHLASYTYPDIVAYRIPGSFLPDTFDTLTNPLLLVEVLPPSTVQTDRVQNFDAYESIESLTDYVIAHQDRTLIEHYTRSTPSKAWTLRRLPVPSDVLDIAVLNAEILLAKVYAKTGLLDG